MRWTIGVSIIAVAASCCCVSDGAATVPLSEGMTPFGFGIEFVGRPDAGGTIGLRVILTGQYDSTAVGEARLVLSPGLECVAGDTLFRSRVTSDPRDIRSLVLRVRGNGAHTVRGILAVTGPNIGRDEAEVEAAITVLPDTVIVGACRQVRLEHIRGGQRYRYAGSYLVPIDDPENVTQDDILEAGQRARAVQQATAKCTKCPTTTAESMAWVVFLGANGHLMDARPLDASKQDPDLVEAARAALDKWSFEPTRIRGKAVNDWLIVRVPITR